MKNRTLLLTAILAGGLALVLPGCNSAPRVEENVSFDDPITYSDETTVSYKNPLEIVRAEADDSYVAPKKVILHYHNDDNACQSRRFYTWVTGVDGVERKPKEL